LPKSCKGIFCSGEYYEFMPNLLSTTTEVEDDKHLDARHAIEEAMSTFLSFMVRKRSLTVLISSCAHEELSPVSERSVIGA
jgi:hypothetical protein